MVKTVLLTGERLQPNPNTEIRSKSFAILNMSFLQPNPNSEIRYRVYMMPSELRVLPTSGESLSKPAVFFKKWGMEDRREE